MLFISMILSSFLPANISKVGQGVVMLSVRIITAMIFLFAVMLSYSWLEHLGLLSGYLILDVMCVMSLMMFILKFVSDTGANVIGIMRL